MRFLKLAFCSIALIGVSAAVSATSDLTATSASVVILIAPKNDAQAPPNTKDLVVRDNREPVQVNELRPLKDEPLLFSVLVDASGSMYPRVSQENAVAIGIFKGLSKPGRQGHLYEFADISSRSKDVLEAFGAERSLDESRRGATVLYDAIDQAVTQQLALRRTNQMSRQAIVVLSDGDDNLSQTTFSGALAELQRADIPLFAVHIPTPIDTSYPYGKRDAKAALEHFRKLSHETGGAMVELDGHRDSVSEIIAAIDSQYMLTIAIQSSNANALHKLEVKCTSGNFVVTAPTLYVPQ